MLANVGLLLAEVAGAAAFRSLALFADAAHLVSDVAGLALALVALHVTGRPSTPRHSFGFERAEVLAAQANGLLLLSAAGWVFYEAVRRLVHPVPVVGGGVIALAGIGLIVNAGSSVLVGRVAGSSLNMRAAFLHLASDAAGSLGAMVAGVSIVAWNLLRADPAISLAIGSLVLSGAWRLLRDATHVLMEGAPEGTDPEEVARVLSAQDGVRDIHHLHLWSLASDVPALSTHVVLSRDVSMRDAQRTGEQLKTVLSERFGIEHVTLELECPPSASAGGADAGPGEA